MVVVRSSLDFWLLLNLFLVVVVVVVVVAVGAIRKVSSQILVDAAH